MTALHARSADSRPVVALSELYVEWIRLDTDGIQLYPLSSRTLCKQEMMITVDKKCPAIVSEQFLILLAWCNLHTSIECADALSGY